MASRITDEEIEFVFHESSILGMSVPVIALNLGVRQSRVRYILKYKKPTSVVCRIAMWFGLTCKKRKNGK